MLHAMACSLVCMFNTRAMSSRNSLREALKVSPDNLPLLEMFAQACMVDSAYSEARGSYDHILHLDPANDTARLGIATILYEEQNYSEAIVRTEALLQENANNGNAWLLLSRIQFIEGSISEAKQSYQKAIQNDSQLVDSEFESRLFLNSPNIDVKESEPDRHPSQSSFAGDDFGSGAGFGQLDRDDDVSPHELWEGIGHIDAPKISFEDVGGMETVKEEIRMKIIYPLQNPDLFKAYGKKIGGGVLIYGPPGCGKTLISQATAGEIHAKFISVGIHEILNMWIGQSEKNMHEIFELARENSPCVLFFDEVDALAANRKDLQHSANRNLINQFLAEMDSTTGDNEGILVIGATNTPWHVDSAFRRPGRFDRILFVPPPDEEARQSIIEIMGKGKPIPELDARALAKKTPKFSGADLKAVFDTTIERSLAAAMKSNKIVPITTKDLVKSAKSIKPSTKQWFETAKNFALYSNQNGIYDDILDYLGIKK